MPFISQVATGLREQLKVFGGDYDTVDGTGVRDYLHVCDLADGHVAALDYLDQCDGVEAFNLGTGNGVSVLELVSAFEEASGHSKSHIKLWIAAPVTSASILGMPAAHQI